jgi:hypothetical protein
MIICCIVHPHVGILASLYNTHLAVEGNPLPIPAIPVVRLAETGSAGTGASGISTVLAGLAPVDLRGIRDLTGTFVALPGGSARRCLPG